MGFGRFEPRWLIGAGVVLVACGYIAIRVVNSVPRALSATGVVAFYAGLALLMVGVVIWLKRSPAPDPFEENDDSYGDDV
jgi:predicted membrane channel-forming protein YqfA (hemolysin III family)